MTQSRTTLSRLKLLGLMAAFVGPFLVAAGLYFYPQIFTPRVASHGELLNPPRTLDDFSTGPAGGGAADAGLVQGAWTLLFWNGGECDLYCEANLFKMRQVRLTLGRDAPRVRSTYLLPASENPDPELEALFSAHPVLTVAYLDQAASPHTAQALAELPWGSIYVVDPLGNLMMRFAREVSARDLIKDLKRLLRASRIG